MDRLNNHNSTKQWRKNRLLEMRGLVEDLAHILWIVRNKQDDKDAWVSLWYDSVLTSEERMEREGWLQEKSKKKLIRAEKKENDKLWIQSDSNLSI